MNPLADCWRVFLCFPMFYIPCIICAVYVHLQAGAAHLACAKIRRLLADNIYKYLIDAMHARSSGASIRGVVISRSRGKLYGQDATCLICCAFARACIIICGVMTRCQVRFLMQNGCHHRSRDRGQRRHEEALYTLHDFQLFSNFTRLKYLVSRC